MNDLKNVKIYTRGIASPGGGAYGALLICDGRRKEISGGEVGASNNRMDLLAAVESLKALKRKCKVQLYNSNAYLKEYTRCQQLARQVIHEQVRRVAESRTNR
jgi:ribonuclease HI